MKQLLQISSVILVLYNLTACAPRHFLLSDNGKYIVGATEVIEVVEGQINFMARVDTGAESCSIHAEAIQVDVSDNPIGKPISFLTTNEKGHSKRLHTHIAAVVTVKTSEGVDIRYKVPLWLKWNNIKKSVLVTLNDRSKLTYRLLLGRNWLEGDFVVDVEKNSEE